MLTRTRLVLTLACLPMLPGCATNHALRAELNGKDVLVRDLRLENTNLKLRLESSIYEKDQIQAALEDAADMLDERPAAVILPANAPASRGFALNSDGLDEVGVSIGRRGGDIVFTIPSKVSFASGSATLSSAGEQALAAVSRRLKADFGAKVSFFVEGHTDSDRIRRSKFKSNRDLSWARARAVHGYLVTRGEISDDRFVVVGHGPHRPVASNALKDGKAQNRRVEIVVR